MRRWIILFLLLIVPFICGFVFFRSIEGVDILVNHYPRVRYTQREDGGVHIDVEFKRERPSSWTPLSSIPSWVQGAVITSEDWAFFQHQGFDFNQIREAVEDKVDGREKKLRGASTLSQQLVKNLFLAQDRSWVRKAREAWLTYRLESKFTKKKILENYLNIIEWGNGVVGIRQAAQHYFQKSPSALNPRESAFLAYLIPSPRRYSRGFARGQMTAFGHQQIARNLERMKQAGYITDVQFQFFSRQRLAFEGGSFSGDPAFDEALEPELGTSSESVSPSPENRQPPALSTAPSTDSQTGEPAIPPENVEEEAPADVSSPSAL
ncbi:MAG: transglycosylase domain-containing protein [Bdellovibrionota bacterium]